MKIVRGKNGSTLIEMLITVALLGILMMGLTSTFRSQVFTFHVQEATTDMQMSGSLSIMKLAQEARLAGFGIPKNPGDGTTTSIIAYVNNDNTAGSADSVTIRYTSGVYGYYNGTPPVSPNKTLALTGTGFTVGDTVKVLSLRREDLFPADTVTVTGVVDNNVTLSKGLYESSILPDLGVFVGTGMADVQYDIVNAGTDNVALRRTVIPVGGTAQPPEIVAFGVEDLQVAYGIDNNADMYVDTYVNTPTAPQLQQIVALRISLIMRSGKQDERASAVGLQAEDGITRGGDKKNRRLFSTTIRLRNARVI